MLPLAEYIPDVEKQIVDWGGKIEDYPDLRVEKKKITVNNRLRELAGQINLELPEHLMKRFIFISKGYLMKERARDATVTLMKRPINIGGLELEDKEVANMLKLLDEHAGELVGEEPKEVTEEPKEVTEEPKEVIEEAKEVEEVTEEREEVIEEAEEKKEPEEVKEPEPPQALPAKAETHELATSVPVVSGSVIEQEEEAEVEEEAHKLKKRQAEDQVATHHKKIEKAVQEASKRVAIICKKNKISKKIFDELATAHIRGTRDPNKTYQLLKEKHKLSGDDLDLIMKALEDARKVVQGEVKKVKEVKEVKEEIVEADKEVMNKRHAALTKMISEEEIEPIVPGARVSAARTKEEELEVQRAKIDEEKLQAAQAASKPAKVKTKLSVPSAPPTSAGIKKVEDVKFARKLVGPVEELGTMGAQEFRRLSSDPVEAVRKIEDKLSLLESYNYEDRIQGIKAWRKSPVNRLYLSMANEALKQGISIAEVASTRRNAGQESLSPADIKAIVGLNNRIKF